MDNGPVIKLCFRTVWGMLRVQKAGRLEIQRRKVPSCNKRLLIVASCESRPGQGLMLLELEITNTRGKKPRRNATKMTFQKKERYDVPVASASRVSWVLLYSTEGAGLVVVQLRQDSPLGRSKTLSKCMGLICYVKYSLLELEIHFRNSRDRHTEVEKKTKYRQIEHFHHTQNQPSIPSIAIELFPSHLIIAQQSFPQSLLPNLPPKLP